MSQIPRAATPLPPKFFVTRQNGNMVPLVAMDELPANVEIQNVSRNLSPFEVSDMIEVGTFDARRRQHMIDSSPDVYGASFVSIPKGNNWFTKDYHHGGSSEHIRSFTDNSLMASAYASADYRPPLTPDLPISASKLNGTGIFPPIPKAFGMEEHPPIESLASELSSPCQAPAANPRFDRQARVAADLPAGRVISSLPFCGKPGVKEYCSYWLRHGECDYAQQGCLYKHEMPLHPAILARLGLRDIPKWYREKHGLGSYLAGGTTMNRTDTEKKSVMERNRRSHPAEVLVQPARGESVAAMQKHTINSKSHNSIRSPSITPPSTDNMRQSSGSPVTYNTRGHRGSDHPKSTISLPIASSKSGSEPTLETVRDRQHRKTLAQLDAYAEKENARLAEKFTVLEPERKSSSGSGSEKGPDAISSTSNMSREETEKINVDIDRTRGLAAAANDERPGEALCGRAQWLGGKIAQLELAKGDGRTGNAVTSKDGRGQVPTANNLPTSRARPAKKTTRAWRKGARTPRDAARNAERRENTQFKAQCVT